MKHAVNRKGNHHAIANWAPRVPALCSGFHQAPASQPYLESIMTELSKFDIDHLIPMHCSGSKFSFTA